MHSEDLVGTWLLESFTAKSSNGVEVFPFGDSPSGLLIYTASGHMAAVVMSSGRSKFASDDIRGGTPEEIKQAFEGFDAYAGTYQLDEEHGTVIHYVEVARFPNWEGTAQARFAKLIGSNLLLDTPPVTAFGQEWVASLAWRRAIPR